MNRPEPPAILPREGESDGPLFAEPWHAEILAIVHGLNVAGLFSPDDWATALGAALRQAEARGAPDDQQTYYAAALVALERLVAERSPATGTALEPRVEAWRRAYLRTPHGQPVLLAAGLAPAAASDHVRD